MAEISYKNKILTLTPSATFSLARSCSCGQAFRFKPFQNGWFGVVCGRGVYLTQEGNSLSIFPCKEEDIPLFTRYFDMERDYAAIEAQLAGDERLSACLHSASGIRIFNQQPFETLISFILSANNNVKRIQGIVEALCEAAGDYVEEEHFSYHRFPTPSALASLSEAEVRAAGAGYRAPFALESARLVAGGYELEALKTMSLNDARKALTRFPGVGPKVADCVLLFSLGHTNAFPMDVWMKRAMRTLFFEGTEPSKSALEAAVESLGPCSGILQQYLFHHAREQGIGV